MAIPILKWAGGKRQLLKSIKKVIGDIDTNNIRYYEPFFGGGALFFDLEPKKATLNDINSELINVYIQVRDNLDLLIENLTQLREAHNEEQFYRIRALDRQEGFSDLDATYRAARTIYLNKTCYNGLYRVNSKGQFNTPSGRYVNPSIFDAVDLRNASKALKKSTISIKSTDYRSSVIRARKGSLIYFDPPYDYENEDGFVGYSKNGFNRDDLRNMKETADKLVDRGCIVLISNNDTPFVRELFEGDHRYEIEYIVHEFDARRSINCNGENRRNGKEVLIYGRKTIVPTSE